MIEAIQPPGRRKPSVMALMVALMAAILTFQVNASMLSPVLTIMRDALETTDARIGLTQSAFFVSAALFSAFVPRWADLVGRKRMMIGLLIGVGIGSVVAAMATTVPVLFAGRAIQGLSGPVIPLALIMLRVQIRRDALYTVLLGILMAVNGGFAGIDAIAGGWLAEQFGFQAVFWAFVGLSIFAVMAIGRGTVESRSTPRVPMDWPGAIMLSLALAAALISLNEAGELAAARLGWVIGLAVLALGSFYAFWRIEKRAEHPLVGTAHLKERRTWALLVTTTLTLTAVFAVMNGLVPNFGQDQVVGPGLSAHRISWLTLTPYALAGLIMGPATGWLAGRWGYRRLLYIGLVGTALGLLLILYAFSRSGVVVLLGSSLVMGMVFAGICPIMLNGLSVELSPADNAGYLPGLTTAAFNIGAALSFVVIFGTQTALQERLGALAGYQSGVMTGGILLLAGLIFALLIPAPDQGESCSIGEDDVGKSG